MKHIDLTQNGTVITNDRFKIVIASPVFASPVDAYNHFTRHLDEVPEASYSEEDVWNLNNLDTLDLIDSYILRDAEISEGFKPRQVLENDRIEETEDSKVTNESEVSENE